jgi:D-alanyl-D-alanine carboxypeptidase
MNKKLVGAIVAAVVVILAAFGAWGYFIYGAKPVAVKKTQQTSNASVHKSTTSPTVSFNKTQYSLTDPTSIWVIANKQHPLQPLDYIPSDLTNPSVPLHSPGADNMKMRAVTATAIEQMFAAAKQANINLQVISAYRSYSYQQSIYGGYVSNVGQAAADQESARPGYSEHQTGLAVDIGALSNVCNLEACFGTTPEGEWLAANAYKYGFLLRYPADKQTITGYEYEPWHFRYIGTGLSMELHNSNIETLEEFFNVSGGTAYKPTS